MICAEHAGLRADQQTHRCTRPASYEVLLMGTWQPVCWQHVARHPHAETRDLERDAIDEYKRWRDLGWSEAELREAFGGR